MSFDEIETMLKITDTETLKRVLHSLSCQKRVNILLKTPDSSKRILTTDVFAVNPAFENKMRKFRIPMARLEDGSGAGGGGSGGGGAGGFGGMNVNKLAADECLHSIDACIIRTMKARKILTHQELQLEVMKQISSRFQPDCKQIKQRIENLIERDYIERDGGENKSYKYVP